MSIDKIKIGVFDSGMGGLSVANAIKKSMPDYEIIYREDTEHVPYGSRSPEEILGFVTPIFQSMVDEGCRVIVIACNTVTTTLIDNLRPMFEIPLIGVEPMVKPAALNTKSNIIAVCATPTTLKSSRYTKLKSELSKDITILEPDCSEWATMIEHSKIEHNKIKNSIEAVIKNGADVIVLACTHYHWIEEEIKSIAAGRAKILQPEGPIIKQLGHVLNNLNKKSP